MSIFILHTPISTMKKRINIPAVHDKQLIKILEDFGLHSKILLQEVNCVICGGKISINNISALKVSGENLDIICDDPECISQLSTQGQHE